MAGWQLNRRRARRRVEVPPHVWALRELEQVEKLQLPAAGQVERYYTSLSDILRAYLERRFQFDTPRQTTAEFLDALQHSSKLSPEQQDRLRDFLGRFDNLHGFFGLAHAICLASLPAVVPFVRRERRWFVTFSILRFVESAARH